jgi:DNA-binding CsgD family transcriptional regulator
VWGAVHVARRGSSGPFQQQDADALAAITGAVARGIRASLRFDAARRINGLEAPGLVVLGPGDEVEMITPPARELLASIAASDLPYTDDDMPAAVLSLAGFVRRAPHAAQGGANVVTVPAKDSWVTLHASRPGSASDGRVAIVIERASAARSATVHLEAFGATAREREVATLLARGLSRVEIAESLVLSPHTVEDHTKSLYDKVGVASRQELVARVFLDEYLPEVAQSTPLTSRGRFDRV